MMNIPMKDFGLNNIVQNHGVLSETLPLIESPPPPHDYEYLCHPTSIVHQPQHLHTNIPQSGVSGDCISSQQSHNNGVVHYGNQGPSTTYSLMSFSERESVTTSLYNLVTTTPVLTTATIINPPTYGPHILSTHETVSSIPNQGGVGHRDTDGVSSTSPSDHRYDELGNLRARNESFPALHNNYPPGHERKMNYQHHFNSSQSSHHRKRKRQSRTMETSDLDEDSETCSSRRTLTPTEEGSKKQNHSEIEKRRRDKMNTYITELSKMIPMCSAMSRKLDKLTVLRMAVQHMKTLRGSRIHSYSEGYYKPSFLTDEELKHLIVQSAEGFLFVVGCDRGRLLYVSTSVSQVLNYTQADLLGHSWFDILHPKDVAKVKEQLSSSDLVPRERLIDAKTMLPVKGNIPQQANSLCPGARRSFFCRMKCKNAPIVKEEEEMDLGCQRRKKSSTSERRFCVIHCTGYLKSWTKTGLDDAEENEADDPCNLSCLVAVGRVLKSINVPPLQSKHAPFTFTSRHAIDGKFVFVDQRTTLVVGFLPQELLGTSMYEYFHHNDIASLAAVHKAVLVSTETVITPFYRFRTKSGNCVKLQSSWKAFRNPWTREIEYMIAKNKLISEESKASSFHSVGARVESYIQSKEHPLGNARDEYRIGSDEIRRMVNTDAPFRKIGEQIADEVLDYQRQKDLSSSNSPISVDPVSSIVSEEVPPSASLSSDFRRVHHSIQYDPQTLGSNVSTLRRNYSQCAPASVTSSGLAAGGSFQLLGISGSQDLSLDNDPLTDHVSTTVPIASNTTSANNTVLKMNGNINSIHNNLICMTNGAEQEMVYSVGETVMSCTPAVRDGNEEADMAVIMSLLDSGPVDFSGLPWPLP